jgi:hypothetical protein
MNCTILKISLTLGLIFSASCRFVSPTTQEVRELNSSGVYENGAPAWAQLPKGESVALPQNAGLVPQTFTVPEAVSLSAAANASSSVNAELGRGVDVSKDEIKVQDSSNKRTLNNPIDKETSSSPLTKLEQLCPGTEEIASKALQEEDVPTRIKKYLSLSKRCPRSSDVWVWLAKDYRLLSRISDARRCVQAALALEPQSIDAKKLSVELGEESE